MSNQPNNTLYINNLNESITKDELRSQLYALFTTHGKIIDIVAMKGQKMRGQAFLVFSDLAGATAAMRACEGMVFYDKPLHIAYAKTKSYAILQREDPNFVPPSAANANASAILAQNGKRLRDDEAEDERRAKREKAEEDSDEEMELEDEDEPTQKTEISATPTSVPPQVHQPSSRLLCTNLPQEVTNDVLSVLFQQYQGLVRTYVTWSPELNEAGHRVKMAQVIYESTELATIAKEALDGFTLKKGWVMKLFYV